MPSEVKNCQYAGVCSGCPWIHLSADDQRLQKLEAFAASDIFRSQVPQILEGPRWGGRDRADLVFERQNAGIYLGFLNSEKSKIVDIETCPQMSARLEIGYRRLREKKPSVSRRGSVRLRVSPQGQFGVWLDFSNQDIKSLLDESSYLEWLNSWAVVEMGQKRKRLFKNSEGAWKLQDPELLPWFESYNQKGQSIPLLGPVGGFSQAGFAVNRILVNEVMNYVRELDRRKPGRWVELFCGNGNFTLPLMEVISQITAIEVDEGAVLGLQKALRLQKSRQDLGQGHSGPNLGEQIQLIRANAQSVSEKLREILVAADYLLVDPPRSGLGRTAGLLVEISEAGVGPRGIVYVSCYLDSLTRDVMALKAVGYQVTRVLGVDQFPQTPHCEWIVLLERSSV